MAHHPRRARCRFNPRAHAGRDPGRQQLDQQHSVVSIHAPTRGATGAPCGSPTSAGVSIHAPTRGATRGIARHQLAQGVSIHAPTRGATAAETTAPSVDTVVSIHAPTRGATSAAWKFQSPLTRFNPRAHAGRDWCMACRRPPRQSFNPRAHAGRDEFSPAVSVGYPWVSIHAPTRGATPRTPSGLPSGRFQSTRPRGARREVAELRLHAGRFQSTRPRGARRARGGRRSCRRCFNPRAHAGRDSMR